MKQLIFISFVFVALVGIVFAGETIPFNQCVKVLNRDGNALTDLNCTFTENYAGYVNEVMTDTGGGFYCFSVTYDYPSGKELDYVVTCTDGSVNNSISGTYSIGGVAGSSTSPPPLIQDKGDSKFFGFVKDNQYLFIGGIGMLVLFVFGYAFNSKRRRR